MPSLHESASEAVATTLSLLNAATERGDVAQAVVGALRAGHILFLVADMAHTGVGEEVGASVRRRFASDYWPPLLTLTVNTQPMALIGIEQSISKPLSRQAEMLIRTGDVALVLAGPEPSGDLREAVERAKAQGAVVAGLGLPAASVEADPAVVLPEASVERCLECQLALGDALAETLARELPAEHPADLDPALVLFGCANCDMTLTIPRHLAGRHGVCPYCFNNTILAPGVAAAQNEKRAHMRFALRNVALRVFLAPPGRPALLLPGHVTLENLSAGGLLFSVTDSRVEIQPDDPLLAELTTAAFQRPIEAHGLVRRVSREVNLTHIGIAFHDIPAATAERLRILESNIVLRNLAPRTEPRTPAH